MFTATHIPGRHARVILNGQIAAELVFPDMELTLYRSQDIPMSILPDRKWSRSTAHGVTWVVTEEEAKAFMDFVKWAQRVTMESDQFRRIVGLIKSEIRFNQELLGE